MKKWRIWKMRDRIPLLMSALMLALICLFLGFGIDSAREMGLGLSGARAAVEAPSISRTLEID